MYDHFKEGVSLAAEISNQLITLSTGMILITITFANSFARKITGGNRRLLIMSWMGFLLTIVIALWHLSALTGNLLAAKIDRTLASAKAPGILEMIVFGLAIFAFVVCAWRSERKEPPLTPPADDVLP
jgi:hypothetical protein